MASLDRYSKHPSAKRAYPVQVDGLGSNTIGVATGAVTVGNTGTGDLVIDSVSVVGSIVYALIHGGVNAVLYQVEITIPISNGEIAIKEFEISVVDN